MLSSRLFSSASTNPSTSNPSSTNADNYSLNNNRIQPKSNSSSPTKTPGFGKNSSNCKSLQLKVAMGEGGKIQRQAKALKGAQSGPGRILRLAVFVSVALNLAMLAFLVLNSYKKPASSGLICDSQIKTCRATKLEQSDKAMGQQNMESKIVTAATGKPLVTPDSVINLDHGDPTMFEAFWKDVGDRATIIIPGWQTMSYFSDVSNLCWFLEPQFAQEVRRLHRLVGNAVVDDMHIVVGTGSTQLFQAALFALAPSDATEPMSVVSAAPYYSSYPTVTDYLRSGLFRWAGDAHKFHGDSYIELVCSPNNPDGALREAVLSSEFGKTVHDLAYYWPQYTPITELADHDVMLFTVSKSTGHAGTRLGWALVKDMDVARRMVKFIELNTIGVSKDSQLRAARVLKVISDGYELADNVDGALRLFDFSQDKLAARWQKLREVVAASSGMFTLPEETSGFCNFRNVRTTTNPSFAWLKCEKQEIEDLEAFLKSHKILTRSGRHFGVDPAFVRISMIDRDETFDLFVKRLSSLS